jgi:hypothetical protein
MSDDPFLPPPVPLMSAVKARNIARSCQGMANHLRDQGAVGEANILERRSTWWTAYSIALSQIPPGRTDDDGVK